MNYIRDEILPPLIKWPGGKTLDFKHLRANFPDLLPQSIDVYYEPFLGGGAVWLAVDNKYPTVVNDICGDLITFYSLIRSQDEEFFGYIYSMDNSWDRLRNLAEDTCNELYVTGELSDRHRDTLNNLSLSDKDKCYTTISSTVRNKLLRIKKVESRYGTLSEKDKLANVEGALKAGYYTYIRNMFNACAKCGDVGALRSAYFYFLRDYCFSSMFRHNNKGEFNVPYGGISYNSRRPTSKADYWKSKNLLEHLNNTKFYNTDFETLLTEIQPTSRDFIFIDPPYDSEFSTYDKNEFGSKDQERLASYLSNNTAAQFLAIMKNTDYIYSLYSNQEKKNIRCVTFDKSYQVSFRNRNDRSVEHLIVYRTY